MSLVQHLKPNGPNGFGNGTTAEQVTEGLSLAGKTILVTGCSSGLGQEAMRVLALRGARVVGTARTVEKARAACAAVRDALPRASCALADVEPLRGELIPLACELADPVSVRGCVEAVMRAGLTLDAIICNAGIMALPKPTQAFGVELQLFTNHVGHFMLVTGLLDRLADEGRVVMLSSAAHKMAPKGGIQFENLSGEKGYTPWGSYGQSKFANLLFAKELARRFAGTKRTANAVHPGVIRTNLGRHMNPVADFLFGAIGPVFLKTVPQGAATEVYAAVHPAVAGTNGAYFADCNVARSRADADDPALAARLWKDTEELVARLPTR